MLASMFIKVLSFSIISSLHLTFWDVWFSDSGLIGLSNGGLELEPWGTPNFAFCCGQSGSILMEVM